MPGRPWTRALPLALAVACACCITMAACRPAASVAPEPGAAALDTESGYPEGLPAMVSPISTPLLPDASGYYPAPANIPVRVEAVDASPHAEILMTLQAELGARSADALAGRVWDDRGGLHMGGPDTVEGGGRADRANARSYLAALLGAGPAPRLQGYVDLDQDCLEVISAPWPGRIVFPTETAPTTYGEPAPEEFDTDAASWRLCGGSAGGQWQWEDWTWLEPEAGAGTYAQLVSRLLAQVQGTYVVLRPPGSDVAGP